MDDENAASPSQTRGDPEPWLRGILPEVHPVNGHLLRAIEQIGEDAESALHDLTTAQVWSKPHGMTSAGFHAKHLAGSTGRLSMYLAGRQLTSGQLSAIATETEGDETADELLKSIHAALGRYHELIQNLTPEDFGVIREIGRKRYRATAISVAIHIVEHAQRHIGGLIAAAKLARATG